MHPKKLSPDRCLSQGHQPYSGHQKSLALSARAGNSPSLYLLELVQPKALSLVPVLLLPSVSGFRFPGAGSQVRDIFSWFADQGDKRETPQWKSKKSVYRVAEAVTYSLSF